ncbi:MAG TPA: hypothetical protein VGG62_03325, partial [Terracidiphilus sp.]
MILITFSRWANGNTTFAYREIADTYKANRPFTFCSRVPSRLAFLTLDSFQRGLIRVHRTRLFCVANHLHSDLFEVYMKVTRREFFNYCAGSAAALGIAGKLGTLERVLAATTGPPIIWIKGASCTGCTVSLA